MAITDEALKELSAVVSEVKKANGKTFGNAGTVIDFASELARIKASECKENGVIEKLREIKENGGTAVPEDLYIKWRVVSAGNVSKLREKVLGADAAQNPERIAMGFHRVADVPKADKPIVAPAAAPQRDRIAAVASAESKPA